MRILQIANKAPYPPNDGSSIAIYNMGMGLIANHVELDLLTVNTKKHFKPDSEIPDEFRQKANYKSVYKNANISILGAFLNLFSSQSYFVSRFYFREFENALLEKLKSKTFDIIQLEGLFMATYIPFMRQYSNAKIVLRAHNIEYLIWERHLVNESSPLKKWYLGIQTKRLKKFELQVLKTIDAIVTITDVDKLFFKSLGFTKPCYTCLTGLNVKAYQDKLAVNYKSKTVFHFASMDWLPNQEAVDWFLENCWTEINKAVPEAKFIIAGRNMPKRFSKLILPNVLVKEKVESAKHFYNEHELMIVPLLSGSGLRIKIIEGMAYGKAIVSTAIGAEGINYTDQKNIIIANNSTNFSKAVIELLLNDSKRTEIENAAVELAEKEFDNKKVVAGLIEFYKSSLNA